jgi:arylsulfatase A-like enzyme
MYDHPTNTKARPRAGAITRRAVLGSMGGALAAPLSAAAGRPNVMLVQCDQLHHAAFGAAGNPVIKTPNIDRIAAEGVRFTHAVCPTPFCSPTRASQLTALYPHKHRITYNVNDPERGLNPDIPSTEQALHDAGYEVNQFGKWHLGDKTRLAPYAGEPEMRYRTHAREVLKEMPAPPEGPISRVGRPIFPTDVVRKANAMYDGKGPSNTWTGRTDVPPEHTEESWIADEAIRSLRSVAGKPFFLTVSFPAPHALWVINDPYYSMYERSSIPLPENRSSVEDVDRTTSAWRFGQLLGEGGLREYLGVYYGMVSMVDANLGRILEELRRLGQDRNTLLIFTADHGDMQGGHGMYDKTTFSMYEETTRIPLLLRYPGKIPAGQVVQTQTGSCDLQPTILDYLGLKPKGQIHGRSLRSYIDGAEDLERPIFSERERGKQHFQRLIRTLEWKYCFSSTGASQLYNLKRDPGETKNLIADSSSKAIKQKLHQRLARWMKETADPRAAEIPAQA